MREMKNSGIEWIGEIPCDWKIERLQWHLSEIKVSNNPIQTEQVLSLTNKLGVIPYEEKGNQGNKSKTNYSEYKLAYPGTIVANSMNIIIGSVGISKYFGCVSPAYYVFKPNQGENLGFINYVMQVQGFQRELRKYANGILEIRLRVSADNILKRPIMFPSMDEQIAITRFLDIKCAEIDSLQMDIQKEIETLEQYRSSIISETVTHGLNTNNIIFKESGISWVKSLPSSWKVIPAKYLFHNSDVRRHPDDELLTASQKYGIITQDEYMTRENSAIVLANKGLDNWKHVVPNDFIISLRSFQGGLEMSETTGCITWHYVVLKASKKIYHPSIAWLAHRLSSLHDADNKIIFDNIVIVTDRVVVDRQLQAAVMGLEHKAGLIRVMDDKCNSADLATALKGNTKIIATTIQKFPYIVDSVANLKKKHFAVIIDEAHSSTAGKDMAAVTKSLGSDYSISEDIVEDVEDVITKEIGKNGKQPNVSMFAFTATPKPTTLQLFGRVNTKGQREAFHIYSMKQAIEEGFILDVLSNYTTYDTFYRINKEIEEDPRCKTVDAKRQIARFVELHDTNISQRIEVIVEHFRQSVMTELGGMAKAMVVTASRQGAVKYRQALENYIIKKGYTDIHALVAFSGKVKLPDDEQEYSEPSMNGFPEDRLTKEFDKDEYNVLLVANKYQTGFDQPKLCAMYVLKKLKGVSAVQTLSRLNRICPPFEKHTFVLDFVNTYDDIKAAFAPYYTTTLLSNSVTPTAIYDLEAKLDAYAVLDPDDIDKANELLYKPKVTGKDKQKLTFYFNKTKNLIEKYELVKQAEIVAMMRHFVRFYEFLLQASCFEDVDLHKKYNFVLYVLAYINIKHPGGGYDLDGKIKATNFVQKKAEEHVKSDLVAQPVMKLPTAESFNLTEAKEERLSQIIAEINSRTGKSYDNGVAVKAMLQIRDIMLKSEKLKTSAKNNSERDFEFSYFDNIDDALIEGLDQNQDFFSLLLGNDEIKREVLGIFAEEIYNSLRKA